MSTLGQSPHSSSEGGPIARTPLSRPGEGAAPALVDQLKVAELNLVCRYPDASSSSDLLTIGVGSVGLAELIRIVKFGKHDGAEARVPVLGDLRFGVLVPFPSQWFLRSPKDIPGNESRLLFDRLGADVYEEGCALLESMSKAERVRVAHGDRLQDIWSISSKVAIPNAQWRAISPFWESLRQLPYDLWGANDVIRESTVFGLPKLESAFGRTLPSTGSTGDAMQRSLSTGL